MRKTFFHMATGDYIVNKKTSPPLAIRTFGDSITLGFGLSAGQGYSPKLAALLSLTEKNYGRSGCILQAATGVSNSGYLFYQQDLMGGDLNDICLIMLGVNDVRDQAGAVYDCTVSRFTTNYNTIVDNLLRKGNYCNRRLILCNVPYQANDANLELSNQYNQVIYNLSQTYKCGYFDICKAVRNNGGNSLLQDGVHPNASGGTVMADSLYAYINTFWI